MSELAEPWSTAAEQAGVRQTYRGIADAAGISHVTVRRLIVEGRTSEATVDRVAEALRVDAAKVYEWAGVERSEWGPWNPPDAHKLHPRARAALEELIRVLTQGGSSDGRLPEDQKSADPVRVTEPAIDLGSDDPAPGYPPPSTEADQRSPADERGRRRRR